MNLTSHDSGTYICNLVNGLGPGHQLETRVEVRESRPATVVHNPARVELVAGGQGRLPCTVLPSFQFIQWTKDGAAFEPGKGVLQTQAGGLEVVRVQQEHAGVYTCR